MNNSPHDQFKQESGSTNENATESTPAPTPPPAVTTPNLVCSFCDKHLPLNKYKKCNCKTTIYCMNASCQKEHWKVHKTEHRKLCKALNAVKNEGEEKDDTKSGSTNKTSSLTIPTKPIQEGKDECPICLGGMPLDASEFLRLNCCGKGLHLHCYEQLNQTKSKTIRDHCPLCRAKFPTTEQKLIEQIQKWVQKKKAWAQFSFANKCRLGSCGVKKDVKRALILLSLAAEQGDANAQFSLAHMYATGYGAQQDVKRAVKLFTLSAEQGLARAQLNLGVMYANGEGVEQSLTTAREWFQKAAAQKHKDAIALLQQIDKDIRRTTTTLTDGQKETSNMNVTAGDKCLVHRLESEAGQLFNGQHVHLVDGIIRKGRLRCKFEDGKIRNVKSINLKKKST